MEMNISKLSLSDRAYPGLFAFVILLRITLFFVPVTYVLHAQEQMVAIPTILVIFGLGFIGLRLTSKAGFADIWDNTISNKQRFFLPALIGLVFGILSVLFDLIQPLATDIQIKLPGSLLVYPIGGILEEIIFRLLLTTFLVWLISSVILRGKWQKLVFWIVAIAVGLVYAFLQISQYAVLSGSPIEPLVAVRFILVIGAFFIVAAYLFRRYGFLAAVSMRLADYLIFHILWGVLSPLSTV
jgi:hypothetical protein